MIIIDEALRLREFDGVYDFALEWYQDLETVRLVDGEGANAHDLVKLKRMYDYLSQKGELYFIEVKENDKWVPIGDVTFWKEDMPIVIGDKNYRKKGIGYRVILALKERARELGYSKIYVDCIYHYNIASQKSFEKAGFVCYKDSEKGKAYRCILNA